MYNIFNYEKGIVNAVLKMAGMAPFDLYNTPGAWPFVLIFLKLWKVMMQKDVSSMEVFRQY